MALAAGARLGPYEIVSLLGAGGMGEVYRGRDTRLGRDVAIKVLPGAASIDPERLARFEQEARATAALNHPNILALYDIGLHDGVPYLVTELLDGETLRERLTRGALPHRKAVEQATRIASGLAAAHEKGIAHRDLKPENVFVSADGHVKILDFGLAKLTDSVGRVLHSGPAGSTEQDRRSIRQRAFSRRTTSRLHSRVCPGTPTWPRRTTEFSVVGPASPWASVRARWPH
jgi:serine/threonine protein kinase